jgi:predicted RNA-binding Zn-ribbon protein involved in translation (DUF1610 family)
MKLAGKVVEGDDDFRIPVYLCPDCGTSAIVPRVPADGFVLRYMCDCGYHGKLIVMYTAIVHPDGTLDLE